MSQVSRDSNLKIPIEIIVYEKKFKQYRRYCCSKKTIATANDEKLNTKELKKSRIRR